MQMQPFPFILIETPQWVQTVVVSSINGFLHQNASGRGCQSRLLASDGNTRLLATRRALLC